MLLHALATAAETAQNSSLMCFILDTHLSLARVCREKTRPRPANLPVSDDDDDDEDWDRGGASSLAVLLFSGKLFACLFFLAIPPP